MGHTSKVIRCAKSHPMDKLKGPAEAGDVPAGAVLIGQGEDVAGNNPLIELL